MSYDTKYDQIRRDREAEKAAEKKIHRKSFLDTFIVMLVLAAIVIILKVPPVYPPLPEAGGGMEILGTDAVGMNDTKDPVASGSPQQTPPAPPVPEPPAPQPEPQPTETQDPDAVAVKKNPPLKQPVKPNPQPVQRQPEKPQPKVDPRNQLNLGGHTSNNNGNNGPGGFNPSKGNGNHSGNQGTPGGSPNGNWSPGIGNGPGSGDVKGPKYQLNGRTMKYAPKFQSSTQEEGVDIIQIVVDPSGNVIEAHGGFKGSTISSPDIIEKDELDAKKMKFDSNSDAPARQYGFTRVEHKLR